MKCVWETVGVALRGVTYAHERCETALCAWVTAKSDTRVFMCDASVCMCVWCVVVNVWCVVVSVCCVVCGM